MLSQRNILIGLVLLGLVGGGVFYWRQQQQAADAARQAAIRQTVAEQGDIFATISATGNLAPQAQVNLFFASTSPAVIAQVNVLLGQAVKPGEVLASLDTTELELAVAEAQQSLTSAQLNLEQLTAPARPEDLAVAEANVKVAKARVYQASQGTSATDEQIAFLNLRLAQNALDQTYALMKQLEAQGRWDQKNDLQAQADQQVQAAKVANLRYQATQNPENFGPVASALAGVEQAQAALDLLKSGPSVEDVQIAELRVSQAEASLQVAQNNLADARIVAPFAGVVAAVNIRAGEPASSALPAIVLADVSHFYLDVAVDEVDVARVAVGQPVTVTLDALPNILLAAIVEKVAPTATNTQGVVSYLVRLSLADSDASLRGGMTATGAIVVAEARAVVLVPNWAIRRDRRTGEAFVGLLHNGVIEEVPVTLGLRDEIYSEIISGVRAGDVIAVDTTREQFRLIGGGG
jgi:HlyD family secretion protein